MINDETLLNILLGSTSEPVFMTDEDGNVLRISKAFEEVSGLNSGRVVDQPIEAMCEMSGGEVISDLVRSTLSVGQASHGKVYFPIQSGYWELIAKPILTVHKITGCVGILRKQKYGAGVGVGFDAVTGLPNMDLFKDRVEQAIFNARRANKFVALMLVGVDRYSEMKDVYGDALGDKLSREVSTRLHHCLRTSDTVARIESDRFALVMQISSVNDSVLLSEKIHQSFEKTFTVEGQGDIAITCSIGVSLFPTDGDLPDDLIKHATVALSHAKADGRGRSQFYSNDMNTRAKHRLELESGIRRGLKNREFLVYYQPKVDVQYSRVAGMESLVRWRDPERGLVSPAEFIPVAEESGLIEQIGMFVLEETCAQNYLWQQQGLPAVRASVNVSARQFRNQNFVELVAEVLDRTGLDPCWLELEITESMLMGDVEPVIARMEALRKLGVYLSIDDFGTGYSSLSYLSRFPVTTLKIDRAFVADLQSNHHTAEITRAIIGLSRGLELEVVAEGAELKEQVEFLTTHGCNLVQGYFYGKPMPAKEFAAMLQGKVREL
jgi:diguanylate cyclase (GGDEF)-like protein